MIDIRINIIWILCEIYINILTVLLPTYHRLHSGSLLEEVLDHLQARTHLIFDLPNILLFASLIPYSCQDSSP